MMTSSFKCLETDRDGAQACQKTQFIQAGVLVKALEPEVDLEQQSLHAFHISDL